MYLLTHNTTHHQTFAIGTLNVRVGSSNVCEENFECSQRDKDDWLRQLRYRPIVRERTTNIRARVPSNVPRNKANVRGD
jgi:hypothetical protein